MDDRVAVLKSPEECERFAKNALERNRRDLADEARKRAVGLRADPMAPRHRRSASALKQSTLMRRCSLPRTVGEHAPQEHGK